MASIRFLRLFLFFGSFNVIANGFNFDIDKPCNAKSVIGQSVICVCDASYCDTITRVEPSFGTYVAYTSSEAGLRFKKTVGDVSLLPKRSFAASKLFIDPSTTYQTISGFGSAVTDAAGINWKSLTDELKQHLVDSYFSKTGLELNMMRVPIGGTDFSTHAYAYNEYPENDYELSGFKLASEDFEYKIPLIKACMEAATSPIQVVGSVWSPPVWMKTSNTLTSGYLKEECYQTFADYFLKWIEKYEESGIPIWGITTTNEPLHHTMFNTSTNRLQWDSPEMGKWIQNNLGPTIRNSTYKNVKIMAADDQTFTIPLWFNVVLVSFPGALEYIDGIAFHWYYNYLTPASLMTESLKGYPGKFLLSTEACEGSGSSSDEKIIMGSWGRAENYTVDIINDLNHDVIGWIDWNMCLNETGGPTWNDNRVDSPIIVLSDGQHFYKQPTFYAMGHFSKFIPRGSRRIKVEVVGAPVENVAVLTPQNTVVIVLHNKGNQRDVVVKLGLLQHAVVHLDAKSITTVEFPYSSV